MPRSSPSAVQDLTYGCVRCHWRGGFEVCVDNLKRTRFPYRQEAAVTSTSRTFVEGDGSPSFSSFFSIRHSVPTRKPLSVISRVAMNFSLVN